MTTMRDYHPVDDRYMLEPRAIDEFVIIAHFNFWSDRNFCYANSNLGICDFC